jgi:molybdopterin-synthase adenylyltransferase
MNWQIRQSFLGPDSEAVFSTVNVAIVGLGGGGSHLAQQLAHVGVTNFAICDPGLYEDKNHNRTVGGMFLDITKGTPKVEIATRLIQGINPLAKIRAIRSKWQEALPILRGCDVLFGSIDGYSERDQLESLSRRFLIPYIDVGMDVHAVGSGYSVQGQVILSIPGSHCMRCFNFLRPELLEWEGREYGAAGNHAQVIWSNGVLASAAVGLFVKLLRPWNAGFRRGSLMLDYDGNRDSIVLSPRVRAISDVVCPHFGNLQDVGDPMWEAHQGTSRLGRIREEREELS